jgi:hypothetical protein
LSPSKSSVVSWSATTMSSASSVPEQKQTSSAAVAFVHFLRTVPSVHGDVRSAQLSSAQLSAERTVPIPKDGWLNPAVRWGWRRRTLGSRLCGLVVGLSFGLETKHSNAVPTATGNRRNGACRGGGLSGGWVSVVTCWRCFAVMVLILERRACACAFACTERHSAKRCALLCAIHSTSIPTEPKPRTCLEVVAPGRMGSMVSGAAAAQTPTRPAPLSGTVPNRNRWRNAVRRQSRNAQPLSPHTLRKE